MARGFISFVLALAVVLPAAGWAWKGSLGSPTPIEELHERAESGDHVVVEGLIVDFRSGQSSYELATIEDDTGQVLVALPQHLRRNVEMKAGENPLHQRVRVAGKWANKYMDKGTWGVLASAIERVED